MGEKLKPVEADQFQYELIICDLEKERDPWLIAKAKMDRAGGHSADANNHFRYHETLMNSRLAELFDCMGRMATAGAQNEAVRD